MVHARPTLPAGHGQVVERPGFDEWTALLGDNRAQAAAWSFEVAGQPIGAVRSLARTELLGAASAFSAKLGVAFREPGAADAPLIATGHQPELYHPGVWVKDFLLERLSRETGASAVDIVVDSDGFDALSVSAPCMTPGVARCQQYLAIGARDSCFAFSPVPSLRDLNDFCASADRMLASLPAPAVRRHFEAFCEALMSAASVSENLAELVTIARRRYESTAHTGYLEAPVTAIVRGEGFARFFVDILLKAGAFSAAYNAELQQYRAISKTRSSIQPFPDLDVGEGTFELPFWLLARGRREPLWAAPIDGGGVALLVGGDRVAELPADSDDAVTAFRAAGLIVAPKALALTLFVRMFLSDLFIHGIGGGRYDLVTNGVIRRFYGVEPPAFVVASMTMYLPLGMHLVTDDEVAAAKERLNRLEHNPDALLGEVEFDSAHERERASALAAEKTELVAAISAPDADRKTIGQRIREVNRELAEVLAPLRESYAEDLANLQTQQAASEILTDRTYPFCFWDPAEIADKVW